MSLKKSLSYLIARFTSGALAELARTTVSDDEILNLLEQLGYNAPSPPSGLVIQLDSLDLVIEKFESIEVLISEDVGDRIEISKKISELLVESHEIYDRLADLGPSMLSDYPNEYLTSTNIVMELPKRLLDYLIVNSFEEDFPEYFSLLQLLGVITLEDYNADPVKYQPAFTLRKIHWTRISQILTDPKVVFKEVYQWGTSEFNWTLMFNILIDYFFSIAKPASPNYLDENLKDFLREGIPEPGEYDIPALKLPIIFTGGSDVEFGLNVLPLIGYGSFSGLALSPYLAGDINSEIYISGDRVLHLDTNLDLGADLGLIFQPDQPLKLIGSNEGAAGTLRIEVEKAYLDDEEGHIVLIGEETGNRLEYRKYSATVGINKVQDHNYELYAELSISSVRLVITSEGTDGFLKKILPQDPIEIDFDLTLGISNTKGFYIVGGVGFEYAFVINKSFGPFFIHYVDLELKANEESLTLISAISGGVQIGPITAVVQGIGLKTELNFDKKGNLGFANLDFGFKLPSSIGLSVNAGGITGGGFLNIDPPNYSGMMQLSFNNEIELTAFGLITTKLPDGRDGFSLVIQIMAEFQPIQLGLGFALTGVGGLIAINRQINEEALIEAFKNHSLDALLFPKNPIKDALKIIGTIQTIMPPREGYHIIGPMVQMFWGGSVKLVEFEVGVFIQTGGPIKIVIIGQARTRLPEGKSPRLVINMDVLGIIDFGEERVAIDAVLFDSKILDFTLDGKMALRSDWSSGEESFALSVGGFHPRFQNIPAGFPKLTRLMVNIGSGNPRLTLQMYMAITPNTLQIGAMFDLWAKKSGFTITGGASFDALFTFSPFSFLVLIKFWVNVKRGWIDLGVDLELELSGPNPMIATGYAKFKVGWFTKKVRFRKQFGNKKPDPLPVVSPVAVLLAELEHKRSIRFELPIWASAGLIFTETAESKIDPVADIIIGQSAVPLNFNMERFGGGKPPEAERRLSVTAGFGADQEKAIKTLFAPEQFKNWSVDERLASKPFEKYDAGIRFNGAYIIPEDALEEREVAFETVLRESRTYRQKQPEGSHKAAKVRTTCIWRPNIAQAQYLVDWSLFGSKTYFKPIRKVRDVDHVNYIKVSEPGFIVTNDLGQNQGPSSSAIESEKHSAMSYAEALDTYKQNNDTDAGIRNAADAVLK